jgi:hypothetical protein
LSTPLHDLNGALPSVGYADTGKNVVVFFVTFVGKFQIKLLT